MSLDNIKISVIGLGYVGYPLFKLFSQHYDCIGLDINPSVIKMLQEKENEQGLYVNNTNISYISHYTVNYSHVADCDIHIVTVPTPVDKDTNPDLRMLTSVCEQLGHYLKQGCLIIFESTVAPGTTDEICIPLLEKNSGMKVNKDFYIGYSPERVNVGDKAHTTSNTEKIISGSSDQALNMVCQLYSSVIEAPLIKASSIKVAEAAKMYENVQRDVLIALSNEYSEYCKAENIDINEVTACASTKWNFAKTYPGLVGGHCIGIDPYYLIDRAKYMGVQLSLINTARDINEQTVSNIAHHFIQCVKKDIGDTNSMTLLVLGFSYKKDTGDIRNTKIADFIDIVSHEFEYLDCMDPLVDKKVALEEYHSQILTSMQELKPQYDICIKMLNHSCFDTFEHNIKYFYSLEQFL